MENKGSSTDIDFIASLSYMVANSDSIFYSIDRDYRYTGFNKRHAVIMKQLYGNDPKPGLSILDLITVDSDRLTAKDNLSRALAGECFVAESFSGERELDRRYFMVSHSPVFSKSREITGAIVIAHDLTEQKTALEKTLKEAERGKLLLSLYEKAGCLSEKELYDYALENAAKLTESSVGFLHIVTENQKKIILTASYNASFSLNEARKWLDCIVYNKPVILNDYSGQQKRKDLHSEDVPVKRLMSIPVMENEKIRFIICVGNKEDEYDENDVVNVQLIANELIRIIRQHRSDTALRESEERYRLIAENTVDTIAVLDPDLKIVYVSPSVFRLRGFTVEEAIKQRIDQIFTPNSLVMIEKLYEEQMSLENMPDADRDRTTTMVVEEYCKDGTTIWVEIVFSFIRDASQNIARILTVTRDITGRRLSEQRIRQLAAIVESTDDAILSKDMNGIITSWNKGAEETYGYSEGDIIGKSIEILMPSGKRSEMSDILTRIGKGEHIEHYETLRLRKDKQLINVSLTVSPMYDLEGNIIGASSIASDITNRIRAEETLKESELKYRTLIEKISAGVIVHRGDTSIEISNTMADELLGLSHDQILGKTMLDSHWDFIRENGTKMPSSEYPVCQVISGKTALRNSIVGINRRKKNDVLWALVNADPVFNSQNEISQVIVTFIDISARKEAEKALQQAHNELELKVEERTAELSKANHQLSALYKIGQIITAPLLLNDVLKAITFNTAQLLGSDTGVILLLDEKREYLTIKGSYGLSEEVVQGTWDRIGESIAGRVVQTGEPIISNNLMRDVRFKNPSAANEGLLSCASVPLTIGGRIIGTLDIHSKTNPEAFGEEHLQLMKMLASQAAIAIEKARLFEELQHAHEQLELKVLERTRELFSANEKLEKGIFELRRTEKALWESSEMLRLVLDNMPAFVFWKNRNSEYLGCNYLFAKNAGLTVSDEIVGKTDYDLPWKLTEADIYRADDRMVIEGGISKLNYEETQLTADGRNTWVRTSKIPLKNSDGDIIGVLGTFEDITEKRRSEREIAQMNRSLRMLSNSNQVLIHTSDENSLLRAICKNIVETGGYIHAWVGLTDPQDKKHGLNMAVHVGNQIQSEWIKTEKAIHGVKNPFEESIRTRTPVIIHNIRTDLKFREFFSDETQYGFSSVISLPLINEENTLGVLVIYSTEADSFNENEYEILTELADDLAFGISSSRSRAKKKRAEESLRLLSKALESAANSIVITDSKANIIWANQAFSSLSGYEISETIGKTPRDLVFSGVQTKDFYRKMWSTIMEGQVWHGEIINKNKNGNLYDEFLTITPVRDENDVISHFIAVKQDITEQKKSANELFMAKEKAEESNRLKSAFLATMNHELRTPLNHIIGFSDLIRSGATLENVTDYADIIHRSSHNLLEIIESIFELAVAEQSEIKLRMKTIKCLDLFVSNKLVLTEIVEKSGKKDQIDLVFNADKKLLLQNITTDTNKINQVLINLFKNAVKFTHSGSIQFGLQSEKSGWLTFYVEDTGIGIPENKHKIIFEFFRQADDSHTREYGGVGIGLAISLKIAEVMQGSITVQSKPGLGSRFNFSLPVFLSEMEQPLNVQSEEEFDVPRFSNCRIIIAEDDPMSMELIRRYLSGTHIMIVEAANGKDVIDKMDEKINLILMDLNMPYMDGYEATMTVKKLKPALPVIALTAYALSSDRDKAFEAGCNSIISKPVERKILIEELRKYLHSFEY